MKILIINYRYYEAGGAERYLFNVTELLEKNGHTVIPFSLRFRMNRPSAFSAYFAEPPGGDESNFYFRDVSKKPGSVFSLLARQFYSKHVYDRLTKLIKDTKPDLAYVFHFLHKMSPSVIDACYDQKIPVVVRLSDFGLICPKNNFYRDGAVCELCQSQLWNSVKYRCVQDSKAASFVNYIAYRFNFLRGFQKKITAIVSPSAFTITRFMQNRHFKDLTFHPIPTFVDPLLLESGKHRKSKGLKKMIYWGRISYEKGIETLLQAKSLLQHEGFKGSLELIGDGEKEYIDKIKRLKTQLQLTDVDHVPFLEKEELYEKIKQADVAVVPSVWYENMPNSLLEAQALGIPVIASDIGSLREVIQDGHNGLFFEAGNAGSLANAIKKIFTDPESINMMGKHAYERAVDRYSAEAHYQKIMTCFNKALRPGLSE